MIVPYLTYCIEVWGSACKTYINPILLLQKRAIRVTSGSGYRDQTNPLFIQLKTLKFNELVEYNLLKTMYKAHLESLPNNLQNRFSKRKSRYELKGTEVFTKPRFLSAVKEKCVTIKGVSLWNSLDCRIKTSTSIYVFKKCVKLSMLQKYNTPE